MKIIVETSINTIQNQPTISSKKSASSEGLPTKSASEMSVTQDIKSYADTITLSEEALKMEKDERTDAEAKLEVNDKSKETESIETTPAEQQQSLKEAIAKLALEIMELSFKVEQLKTKDDIDSLKESRALETELALKKAELNVKQVQLLEIGKLS